MDFIRKMVSGKRNRYKDEEFDIDLTYIQNNIIATSFPSTGFEKIYRNNIYDVSKFLNKKHQDHFLIINVSNLEINKSELFGENNILSYFWKNHNPCSLPILFEIARVCKEFLNKNEKNVVVVHCLSGKGRTGSAIIALLLYLNKIKTLNEGLELYENIRGVPVNHPSQIRYLEYFDLILKNKIFKNKIFEKENLNSFIIKKIKLINFKESIYYFQNLVLRIFLNHDTKILLEEIPFSINNKTDEIIPKNENIIYKDFSLEFFSNNIFKTKKLFWLFFNCDFLETDETVIIKLSENQIDSFKKNKKDLFEIEIHLKKIIEKNLFINTNHYYNLIENSLDNYIN